MNTGTLTNNNDLGVIFPEGKEIIIARPGDQTEKLVIMPLPFKKWKKGFKYIAEIAPALGFDLFGGAITTEQITAASGEELFQKAQELIADKMTDDTVLEVPDAKPANDIDMGKLYNAIMSDTVGDKVLEFMAFAIDKTNPDGSLNTAYFDDMYDEVVDILAAIIEVNLNFFVQKLLPKVIKNIYGMAATAQTIKDAVKR